jgi:hypothetical protein
MRAMTPNHRAVSRVLLVADRRDTRAPRDPSAPRVRRYRLARVQQAGPAATSSDRMPSARAGRRTI